MHIDKLSPNNSRVNENRRTLYQVVVAVLVCCGLLGAQAARAQVVTADIVGTVTDSGGALLPNTAITVTNLGTNEVRTTKTSDSGEFTVTLLPVGNYSVKMEAPGFKIFQIASIALSGGDRARVDGKMEIGRVTETVEVTGLAPTLQTDNSTLAQTVTETAVQDLPLNGRNFVNLAQLAPGATQGGPNAMSGGTRPDDRRQSSAISVNGQPETLNNYMIDGMDNNDRYIGAIAVRPSVDAMQEFSVQTNLYTADVTKTSGGVINIITKAGSNNIHGTLFEFLRNDKVDANGNYNFSNSTPLPKGKYRQNQFGGSIGGPIRKDRTFYFGDYEGLRIVQGVAFTDRVVPTDAQKAGLFPTSTPILDPTLCPSNLATTSPYSVACNDASKNGTKAAPSSIALLQFPNNQIPASRIDSTTKNLLTLFPRATNQNVTGSPNYQNNVSRTQFQHTFDVRTDHRFNESNMIFGRYSFNDITTFTPNAFPSVNGIFGGGCNCGSGNGQTLVPTGSYSGTAKQRAQNVQTNYSHTFTPSVVMQVRLSYLRYALQSLPDNTLTAPSAATQLGIPGVNLGNIRTAGLPQITLFPYASLGDQLFVPELVYENSYQGNGDIHYTKGAHDLTVGFTYIRRHIYLNQSQQPRGWWNFTSTAPSGYTIGTGDTFASFLLDRSQGFTRGIQLVSFGSVGNEIGSYVQDNWRATPWLTINAGLRWDIFTPFSEQHGYMANWSIEQNKLLVANTPGVNDRANVPIDYGDWAPRLGFAATLRQGLVLRGGFGMTYYNGLVSQGPYLQNVPFTFSTTANCGANQATPCPTLAQGAPVPPTSVDLSLANNANITGNVTGLSSQLKLPYIEQWSLNLQKEFHGNVIGVGYVGNAGHRQIVAINQNLAPAPPFTTFCSTGCTPAAAPAALARPLTAAGLFFNPVTRVNNSPNVNVSMNLAYSNYNALQVTVARRTSHGLTLNANYSYAKSLGNAGSTQSIGGNGGLQWISNFSRFDYGRTGLDVRHRVAVQVNYELPTLHSLTGPAGYAVNGWQLNTVYQYSNGLPLTVLNTSNRMDVAGGGADRPNRIAEVQYPHTTKAWFDPSAFQAQPIGYPGTEQVYSVQGTPFRSWDLSVIRYFPITERYRVQFRAEGFNMMNQANFLNPSGTIGSTLGQISGLAGAPRQFQFAAKLQF